MSDKPPFETPLPPLPWSVWKDGLGNRAAILDANEDRIPGLQNIPEPIAAALVEAVNAAAQYEKVVQDARRISDWMPPIEAAALTARVEALEAGLKRLIYLTAPDNSPAGECFICGPMYVDGKYAGHDNGCGWEEARALAGKEKPE